MKFRVAALGEVKGHFGMTEDEAVSEVTRVLGYGRTGSQLRQVIAEEIRLMVSEQLFRRIAHPALAHHGADRC
jgi:hypothetical protein